MSGGGVLAIAVAGIVVVVVVVVAVVVHSNIIHKMAIVPFCKQLLFHDGWFLQTATNEKLPP